MEPTGPYPCGIATIYPPTPGASKRVHRVRYKLADGTPKERTAKDRLAAEQLAAQVTAEQANPSSAVNITVQFLATAYLAGLSEGRYKERQEGLCRLWILPEIGQMLITAWKPAHSTIVLRKMAEAGIGQERINNCARTMRSLISYAQAQGWFTAADDPMLKVRHKVEVEFDEEREEDADEEGEDATFVARETLPLLDDIKLLCKGVFNVAGVAVAEARILSLMWMLAAYSGLRFGELIALKGRDFNLEDRTVRVTKAVTQDSKMNRKLKSTKNKKKRRSILPASMVELLRERIQEVGPAGLMFPGPDGTYMERTYHRRRLVRAAQQAGWEFEDYGSDPTPDQRRWPSPIWTLHSLRHFAACWMIFDLKAPLPTVTAWLGHHSVSFTFNKYVGQRGDDAQIGLSLTEDW